MVRRSPASSRSRADRPLLHTADPGATLQALIEQRYPVYALADIMIDSRDVLFFLSVIGFGLVLAFRSLEKRRWS